MFGISIRPLAARRPSWRCTCWEALEFAGLATAILSAGLAFGPAAMVQAEGPGSPSNARAKAAPKPTPREGPAPADVEFFEKQIRPILTERCQRCHGSAKQKGGLRLDGRASALAGGESGPAVVPGKPAESLLVEAINYGEAYQMPPKSKLPPSEIAALTRWVQMGAPWGPETGHGGPKKPAAPARRGGWQEELRERSRYWSFQPVRRDRPPPESPRGLGWARNPIDQFLLAGLREHGLSPAPEAEKRTLVRRLTYDLIGLPPTPDEIEAFLVDRAPDAYERLVDRLLASPRYGERWARHWLDLVRFAETSGHEFDYDILNAYRYRDYVVRAFNEDLPFDQFVVEHLAGDLLDAPRRRPLEQTNESVLATGFYFLGEGTHSPVDIRADEVSRIDNQIDVISKAFLGLTVACARCHDHKFDPIGAADYYALAGFLRSSRHQQAFIDPPERFGRVVASLESVKHEIAGLLAEAAPALPEPLKGRVVAALGRRTEGPSRTSDRAFAMKHRALEKASTEANEDGEIVFEDFHSGRFDNWFVTGPAFGERPTRAGDFRLDWSGPSPRWFPIAAGQAHSARASDRLWGVLRSRTFAIERRYIHSRVAGRGGTINVVIDNYEKIRDPIYGGLVRTVDVGDRPGWITQDVGMWLGHSAYLEFADGAVVDYRGATSRMVSGAGRLVVDEIRMSNAPRPAQGPGPEHDDGNDANDHDAAIDLGAVIAALRTARDGRGDRLSAVLDRARAIESSVPEPALALAIADGTGQDENIQYRGNYKTPGPIVPRRFLEALGGLGHGSGQGPGAASSPTEQGSGRLELARRFIDPKTNPLTPRVLVNRLWQHHFGTGIVKSVDDFGAMGRAPSHPELLDWLASEFVRQGWSIKAVQRLIVTSSAYRMSSAPSADAERADPENVYLHRMNVRRLEAETLRDALLAVSGRLAEKMYGPSVPVHLTGFMEGRGRPAQSGPWDGDGRRSLYLNVRRNFLDPMLAAFDAPTPFSTMGRRNVSQVPAQALILMNDPAVVRVARLWAERSARAPSVAGPSVRERDRERIASLFVAAFGRPPEAAEIRACLSFLAGAATAAPAPAAGAPERGEAAWAALCHVLFNMKEFLFVN